MNLKHLLLTVSALLPAASLRAKGPAAPPAGAGQTTPAPAAAPGETSAEGAESADPSDPAALLQEALYLRDTEQNLPAAMEVLREVLASQPPAELALQAQLQLAVCQLASGQQQEAMTGIEALLAQRMEQPGGANRADDPELAEFMEGLSLMGANAMNKVERKELLEAALKGAAQRLAPEADFIPEMEKRMIFDDELVGVGAVLAMDGQQVVIRDVVPGSPAERAAIPKGTLILKVNGKTISEFGGKLERIVSAIRGKEGTAIALVCRFPETGEENTVTLTRQKIRLQEEAPFGPHLTNADGTPDFIADDESKIVSIWCSVFKENLADRIQAALAAQPEARGLILDLRGNGGGSLEEAVKLADLFLTKGVILTTRRGGNEQEQRRARAKGTLPEIPMVVLVNGGTASAAEIVTSALQDNKRATIMGERTFGRGTVYTLQQVAGKGYMKLPIESLVRPNGTPLERAPGMTEADAWGVTPDIALPAVKTVQIFSKDGKPIAVEPRFAPRTAEQRRDAQWDAALEKVRSMIQQQ